MAQQKLVWPRSTYSNSDQASKIERFAQSQQQPRQAGEIKQTCPKGDQVGEQEFKGRQGVCRVCFSNPVDQDVGKLFCEVWRTSDEH